MAPKILQPSWHDLPFGETIQEGSGKAVSLCSFIDSSPLNLAVTDGPEATVSVTVRYAPVVTIFKCVDKHPLCGRNQYFLTIEDEKNVPIIDRVVMMNQVPDPVPVTTIDRLTRISLPAPSNVVLTAAQIRENNP